VDLYDWLLLFHVLAAAALFATLVIYGAELVLRHRGEGSAQAASLGGIVRLGGLMYDVGGFLVLVLGIWLAFEADYGITDEWVLAAIVFWVVAAATGTRTRVALLGRGGRQDARERPPDEPPGARLGRATVFYWGMVASVLVLLLLMIFKPGAG
jgi:uncharacterized membrane protein